MTRPDTEQSLAGLIDQAITANRAVVAKLNETSVSDCITALDRTASGTALLHDLRRSINNLNRLLPFRG